MMQFRILNNVDFDLLIGLSDGVTGYLSDKQISEIIRSTDKKELSRRLVEAALSTKDTVREELRGRSDYFEEIFGGGDNATAGVLENRGGDIDER